MLRLVGLVALVGTLVVTSASAVADPVILSGNGVVFTHPEENSVPRDVPESIGSAAVTARANCCGHLPARCPRS